MGLTHLDSGVVIGFLDADDAHHPAARELLVRAADEGDHLALAASALAECLVGPARHGDGAVDVVRTLIERLPAEVVHLDTDTATAAARLRARHGSLRLPDALVIATAAVAGADRLVTTDARWPTATAMGLNLTVQVLHEGG